MSEQSSTTFPLRKGPLLYIMAVAVGLSYGLFLKDQLMSHDLPGLVFSSIAVIWSLCIIFRQTFVTISPEGLTYQTNFATWFVAKEHIRTWEVYKSWFSSYEHLVVILEPSFFTQPISSLFDLWKQWHFKRGRFGINLYFMTEEEKTQLGLAMRQLVP
jgi:hypothetical protein